MEGEDMETGGEVEAEGEVEVVKEAEVRKGGTGYRCRVEAAC